MTTNGDEVTVRRVLVVEVRRQNNAVYCLLLCTDWVFAMSRGKEWAQGVRLRMTFLSWNTSLEHYILRLPTSIFNIAIIKKKIIMMCPISNLIINFEQGIPRLPSWKESWTPRRTTCWSWNISLKPHILRLTSPSFSSFIGISVTLYLKVGKLEKEQSQKKRKLSG